MSKNSGQQSHNANPILSAAARLLLAAVIFLFYATISVMLVAVGSVFVGQFTIGSPIFDPTAIEMVKALAWPLVVLAIAVAAFFSSTLKDLVARVSRLKIGEYEVGF